MREARSTLPLTNTHRWQQSICSFAFFATPNIFKQTRWFIGARGCKFPHLSRAFFQGKAWSLTESLSSLSQWLYCRSRSYCIHSRLSDPYLQLLARFDRFHLFCAFGHHPAQHVLDLRPRRLSSRISRPEERFRISYTFDIDWEFLVRRRHLQYCEVDNRRIQSWQHW